MFRSALFGILQFFFVILHSDNMKTSSYGTWTSPITPEKIAEGSVVIQHMLLDGENTYWSEMRSANKGRSTIVRCDVSGRLEEVTPHDFDVRALVHEYGGGSFAVASGIVYATNSKNNALYVFENGKPPRQLTEGQEKIESSGGPHKWKGTRFADMQISPYGLFAVAEHQEPEQPVENFIALIDTKTGKYKKITSGADFYASPSISPDHKKLAWICWNNPHMPWEESELWIADINADGTISHKKQIAGNLPESILQPQWDSDGTLYFISDRSNGWWNLHSYSDGTIKHICPMEAEIGEPLWILGKSIYAILNEKIFFAYNSLGKWKLGTLDKKTKEWKTIDRPSVYITQIRAGARSVSFIEGYPDKDEAIIRLGDNLSITLKTAAQDEKVTQDFVNLPSSTAFFTIIHSTPPIFDSGYISKPEHIEFRSENRTAYGYFYPPCNKDFQGPAGEKPPLIVMIHGGPTAQARNTLNLKHQYWTSRGFSIIDVNYGGSTGYGRPYRLLLNRHWGIVDVQDCINGALYLADKGMVDKNNLFIRGGSAGGYTTLAALASTKIFKGGASYYGVADITALVHDTHKFEAHYIDGLIGKYPEEKAVWETRSPINSVNKISTPLIIFQGENDPIVPKNQSIMIYEALNAKGVPVEIYIYPEEGHGFKQAANVCHSLTKEAEFYLKTRLTQ